MKCIEYKDGHIVRISNETAVDLVANGSARYVSKTAWRAAGAEFDGRRESRGRVSIHPPTGWLNKSNQKPRWARR